MAGGVITNDGSAQGIKFTEDSGNYTVPQVDVVSGINQTIAFWNGLLFKRDITVECRSTTAQTKLMTALMNSEGIVISGTQYTVISISPAGSFGENDTSIEPVYTYRLELAMI